RHGAAESQRAGPLANRRRLGGSGSQGLPTHDRRPRPDRAAPPAPGVVLRGRGQTVLTEGPPCPSSAAAELSGWNCLTRRVATQLAVTPDADLRADGGVWVVGVAEQNP